MSEINRVKTHPPVAGIPDSKVILKFYRFETISYGRLMNGQNIIARRGGVAWNLVIVLPGLY